MAFRVHRVNVTESMTDCSYVVLYNLAEKDWLGYLVVTDEVSKQSFTLKHAHNARRWRLESYVDLERICKIQVVEKLPEWTSSTTQLFLAVFAKRFAEFLANPADNPLPEKLDLTETRNSLETRDRQECGITE